ncbi:DUF4214 domain-containing protein [Salinarimonas ramus]|uniref:DUF4214 domain-containing protein n=1 Tax=Salinarimonas ramus TaxID=690164 RepID=A0A917Q400_9HYPH|nr:DUF4214 domain-containing protein [Salinarimonas ramus]GGK18211.1 hypothetical protein GCM10011322_01170 [Salinarimonas ramus]
MADINGTPASETLPGTDGDDSFIGGDGADTLQGGAGFDRVNYAEEGGPGGVLVDFGGGPGRDTFGAADRLQSIEFALGTAFADEFRGTSGSNGAAGLAGADIFDLGDGFDDVRYTFDEEYGGTSGIQVDLSRQFAIDGFGDRDTLIGVERVRGTRFDDSFVGDDRDNQFAGNAGNDVFDGRGGYDSMHFILETGAQTIDQTAIGVIVDFNAGTARHGGAARQDEVDRFSGMENAEGTNRADVFIALTENGDHFFVGYAGNDTFQGGSGFEQVSYAGERFFGGDRGIVFDWSTGTAIDTFGHEDRHSNIDLVRGTLLADRFVGDDGRNQVRGLAGDDIIDLGGGVDEVRYEMDANEGGAAGVMVDLAAGFAIDGFGDRDTLIGVEQVRGTDFADRLMGDGADNRLRGLDGADELAGAGGNDRLEGGRGDDAIDGGAGRDAAVFSGARGEYAVTSGAAGLIVSDTTSGRDGIDRLTNVERLVFTDSTLAFDFDGTAGQAYRLYQAAFARTPDQGGVSFWTNAFDRGEQDLIGAATFFLASPEFAATYGSPGTVSDAAFVALLYQNVLGRGPDDGGNAFWLGELAGGRSRENVLVQFSESPENVALVAPAIASGIVLDVGIA